jgi:hypothetical protein
MLYTLIAHERDEKYKCPFRVTVEFEESSLPEILRNFEYFLRACGFAVDMESLDIIKEEPATELED